MGCELAQTQQVGSWRQPICVDISYPQAWPTIVPGDDEQMRCIGFPLAARPARPELGDGSWCAGIGVGRSQASQTGLGGDGSAPIAPSRSLAADATRCPERWADLLRAWLPRFGSRAHLLRPLWGHVGEKCQREQNHASRRHRAGSFTRRTAGPLPPRRPAAEDVPPSPTLSQKGVAVLGLMAYR